MSVGGMEHCRGAEDVESELSFMYLSWRGGGVVVWMSPPPHEHLRRKLNSRLPSRASGLHAYVSKRSRRVRPIGRSSLLMRSATG
jgi:hypothetical protein